MCSNLSDQQINIVCYIHWVSYMNCRVTKNQKFIIDTQKIKRKESNQKFKVIMYKGREKEKNQKITTNNQ